MRSAILLRMLARAVVDVSAQARLAACAASSAASMSSALERATSVKTLPVTGVVFSKYWPLRGATHWPPMKFP
ncbi:hypothetical protein D3C71_1926930 [compost metagenome]